MGIIQRVSNFFEKRNLASAYVIRHNKQPAPVYNTWTIKKAVEQGYKQNSWVYRSIFLKSVAAGSVSWVVKNEDGETIKDHPINKLMQFPNPYISKQNIFELIASWLELAGNGYLIKVKANNQTKELWPISPDRLHPIPTSDPRKWIEGYALDRSKTKTYEPEEIIQFKYFNPANPLLGISPLEVVAKTVDVDNDQRDFNKATSQNRGVVDGVFVFKRRFNSQQEADAIRDSINERHGGRRTFGVIGDEANYVRTALTPAEMDFINSRKSNREEIFIAFGVPPIYAGVVEGATMNNYKTSELIFWFGTMLFFLDNQKDTLNFVFKDELGNGAYIDYDITNIPAIRDALLAKTKTAKTLFEMGVPFEQLNKVFKFGVDYFDGWDISYPSTASTSENIKPDTETKSAKRPYEFRATTKSVEKAIKAATATNMRVIMDLFDTQKDLVFQALENNLNADIEQIINDSKSLWYDKIYNMYLTTGAKAGTDFVLETRASKSEIEKAIQDYLTAESIILTEVSEINATTVEKIIKQVSSALETGASVVELQQAIIDTGILEEKRALGLARTISGNAVNLGQWKGAAAAGATHKTWMTASSEVRKSHQKMDGVTVGINDYFRVGGHKARYPLDNALPPKERMNCRCTMTYKIG